MNYYSVLGVPKDASQIDIKQAYRKLAMKHHPDREGGNSAKLSEINAAYEVVGNPTKRAEYDKPQHFFTSDNFAQAFNENAYRHHVVRNSNTVLIAEINLKDVVNGKPLLVSYRMASGREEAIEIDIPAGINDGQVLRFRGKGDNSFDGPRGDLLIKIKVRPMANWGRQDSDLVLLYKVNAIDMILGTKVTITTLDDRKIELKIPEGTKTDTKFSVTEYGLLDTRTNKKGNLYVHIIPEITKINDEQLKTQLRNYRNETS